MTSNMYKVARLYPKVNFLLLYFSSYILEQTQHRRRCKCHVLIHLENDFDLSDFWWRMKQRPQYYTDGLLDTERQTHFFGEVFQEQLKFHLAKMKKIIMQKGRQRQLIFIFCYKKLNPDQCKYPNFVIYCWYFHGFQSGPNMSRLGRNLGLNWYSYGWSRWWRVRFPGQS